MPAAALGPAFDLISYDDYVQGPRAPERMARLKQNLAQGCHEEAGEVTGWPIDQIQSAVQPDERQSLMLDDLGNAVVKASDEIRAHCQTNIATTATIRGQCDAGMMAWPTDQIDRVVRHDDAQRAKLQALVASRRYDQGRLSGRDVPPTPPARLAAVGQRLQAMLQGVETMQPALSDFYNSLSDDQKARFNSMGRQLFAQNGGRQSSNEQREAR